MNWGTVAIGVLMMGYGAWSGYARFRTPEKFAKLDPMKKAYGEKAGTIVHVVGYTLLPMLLGAVIVITGIRGGAIFGG